MTEKQDDINIPWWQKLLALGAVVAIVVLIFVIVTAIFGKPSEQEVKDRAIQNCGTSRFASDIDCPEPDYDKELRETINQYPDDSY